ncbi:CBS domain-containing protein [Pseudolabrys taiwanensis]|uniref:CBS domain-containing protein n=1 Tax=Pseudolabrys taiwanensis TaxID=331696 RepID=A0A346A4L1_9HYPH|nr:CBS domain-containing protein [Pseudolabrys taiwanensis]AXK84108.1 CBS domain-containing protein [Pseudolabrys taiwanensis]
MLIETLRPMTSARLATVTANATLLTAARVLSRPQVGLLIVCDESGRVAGVLSKSDVIRHLTNAGITEASAANVMSRGVVSCRPEDDLYATWQKMTARSLQNMPVLDADLMPLGVLDIRDALRALFMNEEYQERLLQNYIDGVGYQ